MAADLEAADSAAAPTSVAEEVDMLVVLADFIALPHFTAARSVRGDHEFAKLG